MKPLTKRICTGLVFVLYSLGLLGIGYAGGKLLRWALEDLHLI